MKQIHVFKFFNRLQHFLKGNEGFLKQGLSILPPQVVPTPCPYLDRLWGSYELLLDLLLLDVLIGIT